MFNIWKLKRAKFNGIEILVENSEITFGQKNVVHNFTGSDRTEVESLGKIKRVFTINMYVHGERYWTQRQALIKDLEWDGVSTFIHPYSGEIRCKPTDFPRIVENDKTMGICKIRITLQEVSESENPQQTVAVEKTFVEKLDEGFASLLESYESTGINSLLNGQRFTAGAEKMLAVFEGTLNNILSLSDNLNIFNSTFETSQSVIKDSSSTPSEIGGALIKLFQAQIGLAKDPVDQKRINDKFKVYEKATKSTINTFEEIENQENEELLEITSKASSLMMNLQNGFEITFDNAQEKDNFKKEIDEFYFEIYELIPESMLDEIQKMRGLLFDYLDGLELSNLITVDLKGESLDVFVYRYYGNTNLFERIVNLNQISNPAYIKGEIQIYE